MARPRLLFVSHRLPYPPNKGDKIRSYHILRHLARRVETFEVLGPVERLASANVGGIKNLRVRMRMARLESASKPA